jgi:AraC-like DNA-binding protein
MYLEYSAGAALQRVVECCWSMETGGEVNYAVRPDGCLDIVYSRETGLRAVGAMTVERRFALPAGSKTIGVRFRPGMARPFLGVSPAEFTESTVALDDLWGSRACDLEGRLESQMSPRILAAALTAPPAPDPVKRAIEAMVEACGAVDLDWVAAQAGMSPRQFRRRCLEESGLAPKQLCRILRFRHACEMAAAGGNRWAAIAADAGYFDQAHLIRDFREFTGRAPVAVFSNTASGESIQNQA